MSPLELAKRHPLIYHITTPGSWQNIKEKGLLTTSHILDLYSVHQEQRLELETKRRSKEITLKEDKLGQIILNDNLPLSEKALAKCLDDDLSPRDWFRMLNARVFFWPSEACLHKHLNAKLNRQRTREIIVIDTLRFTEKYAEEIELSPINSGSTIRAAARRGLKTFTPLLRYSFSDWRKLRNGYDHIREITVKGSILDIANYVTKVYRVKGLKPVKDSLTETFE